VEKLIEKEDDYEKEKLIEKEEDDEKELISDLDELKKRKRRKQVTQERIDETKGKCSHF